MEAAATADHRVVSRLRSGDERAMSAIYERHHRGLLSFCRHMLGSREEAEDAVRETFLSAQRALLDSEEPVALPPWLYAIALNRCRSMVRAGAARPREEPDSVLRDLDRLPEDERAALLLAESGALAPDEIAQVLGVPTERAEALVVRARDTLIRPRRPLTTSCTAVRAELARPGEGRLRRADVRRHLRSCPRCRGYRESVRRQHAALAAPVVATARLRQATVGGVPRPRHRAPVPKLALAVVGGIVAVVLAVAAVDALSRGSADGPAGRPAATEAAKSPPPAARPAATPAAVAPQAKPHRRHHRRHRHRSAAASSAPAAAPAQVVQPAPAPAPPPVVKPKPKRTDKPKKGFGHGPGSGQQGQSGTSAPTPAAQPKTPKTPSAPKTPAPAPSQAPSNVAGGTAAPPAESSHGGKGTGGGGSTD